MTLSTPDQENLNSLSAKRKKLFLMLTVSFCVVFLCFCVHFYFVSSKHETTDNAYVGAEIAQIAAQTVGTVKTINFKDTDYVKEGEIVVVLDDTDAKLVLERAKAELDKATADFEKTKLDSDRRIALSKTGSVSDEEVTTTSNAHKIAKALLDSAKVFVEQAEVDLNRTIIKAPISGILSKRQVQIGQRVQQGVPLFSIVPKDDLHVDANFKETQVKKIKEGQDVTMTTDVYGDSVVYHGKVVGISGGTGAAFAVIPAQNATGNWIKVVQRLPVRISLDPKELEKYPLHVGLSVNVDIVVG
ncbi:MAG: putative multidrug resistance protein EmrK [Holosporales bacterium]